MSGAVEPETPPYLRACLVVSGYFDPQAFGEAVGLEADEVTRPGEVPRMPGSVGCSEWELDVPSRYSFDMDEILTDLLDRVGGHGERPRETVETWNLGMTLVLMVEWDARRTSSPSMTFSVENMRRLVALGAPVEVDLHPQPLKFL